jgi:hypothetical protein
MKEGESFFYSVDHKNAQYGTYLRRRSDGKDGVYIIAIDTKSDQQGGQSGGGSSGGGASARAGGGGGGGGGQKEDRVSIAHVEKDKQERKGKGGASGKGGGGGGAGGQTGQQGGGQQQFVHEGKSVNTEVRLTKKRIQFFKKSSGGGGGGGGAREVETRADSGGGGGGGSRQDGELRGYWDNDETKWWWKADKNIENETGQDYKIKSDGKTHFTASKHIRIGDLKRQGNEYLSGVDYAADHVTGTVNVDPTGQRDDEVIVGVSLVDIGARVAALEQTFFGRRQIISSDTVIGPASSRQILLCNANALFSVSFGDPATYPDTFGVMLVNTDVYSGVGTGRAKRIVLNGVQFPQFLWPSTTRFVYIANGQWKVFPEAERWTTSASPRFYIDPVNGDDLANDGLAPGAGGAFLTGSTALSAIKQQVDFQGAGPEFIFQAGVHPPLQLEAYAWPGGNALTLTGDVVTPSNVQISVPVGQAGMAFREPQTVVIINGFTFGAQGSGCTAIQATQGVVLDINYCRFTDFPGGVCISADEQCMINIYQADIAPVGAIGTFMGLANQSYCVWTGAWTIADNIAYNYFIIVQDGSYLTNNAFSWTGGATSSGTPYLAAYNSKINLGNGVADTLPGDVAGVCGVAVLHGTDSSMVL